MTRSRRSVLRIAAVSGLALAAPLALPGAGVAGGDKDCSDFRTQRQAQRFLKRNGGPRKDPHGLNADKDGKAGESLPRR